MNILRNARLRALMLLLCPATSWLSSCQSPQELTTPSSTLPTASARIASATGICGYDHAAGTESGLRAAGWNKIFDEPFALSPTNTLNPNWNVWVGGSFNNELQLFTDKPENLTVVPDPEQSGNQVLLIQARKEAVTGPRYRQDIDATPTSFAFTAARIESRTMFAPNRTHSQVRMVARIKLPTGYGMWPAFWSYGDAWPTNGEIDVLEARGNEPYQFQTNYFFGRKRDENLVRNAETYITSATSLTDCWHVYEVIWTRDALTFLLDGQVIDVKTGGYVSNLFGRPEKITLSLSVGGDFFYANGTRPTPEQIPLNSGEGTMLVDWVKVFVKR